MENLSNFITEKLQINSKIKSKNDDLDYLTDDDFVLWNSDDNSGDEYIDYIDDLYNEIEHKYDYFIYTRFDSLSTLFDKYYNKNKNINTLIDNIDYNEYFKKITQKIITGRDYGYEIKLVRGHIEIDCINSGSCGTYYIYAITYKGYIDVDDWFTDGCDDEAQKDFLYSIIKENIVPIEL